MIKDITFDSLNQNISFNLLYNKNQYYNILLNNQYLTIC